MIVTVFFWVFLLSACALMLVFGGNQERTFVGAVGLATVITLFFNANLSFVAALPFVTIIDATLLTLALSYIVKSDRYWPIWFAGFHFNTIATEVAALMFPGARQGLYVSLAGVWALPALGMSAYGCFLDRRLQIKPT